MADRRPKTGLGVRRFGLRLLVQGRRNAHPRPSIRGSGMTRRFVLSASYGNDSIAMLRWAYEQELADVTVVYCDTGWAAEG